MWISTSAGARGGQPETDMRDTTRRDAPFGTCSIDTLILTEAGVWLVPLPLRLALALALLLLPPLPATSPGWGDGRAEHSRPAEGSAETQELEPCWC